MIKFNTIISCLFIAVLTVDSVHAQSGNVGIGTDSPGSLLHLFSTLNGSRGISIGAQGTQSSQHAYLELITEGDGTAKLGEVSNKGWHITGRGAAYGNVDQQNDLLISNWNGLNWKEIMFLETMGNVGVGTSSPLARFHILGDFVAVDTLDLGSPDPPPVSGAGTRMMWYPAKAAFRAGHLYTFGQTFWDKDSIGDFSVAFGEDNMAKGDNSSAFGAENIASGAYSFALGVGNTASGSGAIATGNLTEASGIRSVTFGASTVADGAQAIAAGNNTLADALDAFALGRYNVGGGTGYNWISTDPLFEIGIGTDGANRANAMTVLKNGNVGIGTASPGSLLHLFSTSNGSHGISIGAQGTQLSQQAYLELITEGDGTAKLGEASNKGWHFTGRGAAYGLVEQQNDLLFSNWNGTDWKEVMFLETTGNVGIGTSSPSALLHIKRGTGSGNPTSSHVDAFLEDDYAYLEFSGNPFAGITFKDDGASLYAGVLYNYQNDWLEFRSGNTPYLTLGETGLLTLLGGGKLGIGVTPQHPLHVESSTADRTGYLLNTKNTSSTTYGIYAGAFGAGTGAKRGGSFDANGGTGTNTGVRATAIDGTTNIGVYASATGGTTNWAGHFDNGDVIIDDNLGIGTTSPSALLHIKRGTGSGNPTSSHVDAFLEDDYAYLEFSGNPFAGITFKDDGASLHAGVLYNYQNDWLEFLSGNTSYLTLGETGLLTLLGGGKLGIGVTPQHPLHVESSTADRTGYLLNTKNTSSTSYGIYAGAFGAGSGDKRGGSFDANGGTGANTGVRATAIDGTTNIGVYASATGGTTNWAGHFDNGNVIIDDKLGVGTTNPSDKVNISGGDLRIDDNNPFIIVNSTLAGQGSGMNFKQNGTTTGWLYFDDTDDLLRLNAAFSADRNDLVITTAGNVGIGTMTPEAALHVEGNIEIDQQLIANDAGGLEFLTDDGVIRMKIQDNGYIGIGTTAPQEALHVEGNIEVDQQIRANDAGGLEFASDEGTIRLKIQDNGYVGIGTTAPGYLLDVTGESQIQGTLRANLLLDRNNTAYYVDPASSANAAILNGRVGIGTTAPGSHQIYVSSSGGGASGSTGYVRNTASNGIAMSVENTSASSSDNVLLVSTQGTGDIASFDSYHGGGAWDREFKFTNTGDGRCDGSWIGGGADYAEFFKLADVDEVVKPGDVIAMSQTIGYSVEKASASKNQLVLGVYSTNPVVVGNSSAEEDPEDAVVVGLMGVVPTNVCAENGAIRIGDFVTTSSIAGVAAKAISSGMVIGRAMENYDAAIPGLIKVMVDVGYVNLDNANETETLRAELQELRAMVEKLAGQQ